jgi:hypothetical protein
LICRARWHAEHEAPLLLGQCPEIRDRQKGPQARRAQTTPVAWCEAPAIQAQWAWLDVFAWTVSDRRGSSCSHDFGHSPYLGTIQDATRSNGLGPWQNLNSRQHNDEGAPLPSPSGLVQPSLARSDDWSLYAPRANWTASSDRRAARGIRGRDVG